MILNSSHFNSGDLYIPNAQGAVSTFAATNTGIQNFIDKCEELVISDALSPSTWQAIKSNYTNNILDANAPQWVQDLINGTTYTYENKEYTFKGLGHSHSCLAYFIFNKYLIENYGSLGIDGMQHDNNSAATPINPTAKDVETWNAFVTMYQGQNITQNLPIITHSYYGTLIDYYAKGKVSSIVDLLSFIEHYNALNPDTYSVVNGRLYERKNSFGL